MFAKPWMRSLPLMLAMTLALAAQDGDLAERLFRSGERAYATRSYPEAFETWGQLLQSSPKSPFAAEALLRMARHRLDVDKKPDEALPLLERLKTDHIKTPFAAEGLLLRGMILAARSHKPQELKDAIAEFNRVLDLFPDHEVVQNARYQLGMAFRSQGQWGRALQQFMEVMRLDPTASAAPRPSCRLPRSWTSWGISLAVCASCRGSGTSSRRPLRPPKPRGG